MLTLQRASAGSGKTYTLAKTFLRLFLSVKDESGSRRLRNSFEIKDSLGHILAITFTNKATAEMKQRILTALAALSEPDSGPETDYFSDFISEFATTPEKLRAKAREALECLLGNYSDFKVSTIDTFFQTILRTFAYETNLNDNYSVEIETDFIYGMAIDALMEEIDARSDATDTYFWFKTLMDRAMEKGNKWDVFKKDGKSIYGNIQKSMRKFESESFKEVRESLEEFCSKHSLADSYRQMENKANATRNALLPAIMEAAKKLYDTAIENGYSIDDLGRYSKSVVKNWQEGKLYKSTENPGALLKSTIDKEFNKTTIGLTSNYNDLIKTYEKASSVWDIHSVLFPYLGLMMEAHRHIRRFLDENNLVILADTNSLLRRIISDDDTPFIYERLGGRLNHLLIDEFQDTSRLQWANIRPLLAESLARGEESLLIGDAKQSIYRFRNADPSIITELVPQAFPEAEIKGDKESENTNYRSERNVIQFNNFLFSRLTRILGLGMDKLYSNVVQTPGKTRECGFVSYRELPKGRKDISQEIAPMVCRLLQRGYRQKDICFLVRTNSEAMQIIDSLIAYNASRPQESPAIEFMSEESLKISSSQAVRTIINCLENIASAASLKNAAAGNDRKDEENPQAGHRKVNWHDIRAELPFFMIRHPELTPDEQIDMFLNQMEHEDILGDLLGSMQAATLPALVEALAHSFLSAEQRRSEAPYLTALQDCVLDYCGHYATDIHSFLEWWKIKGTSLSIASPEEIDAVKIMTIHKSKGLEFPVVILPQCNLPASKIESADKAGWKWVRPAINDHAGIPLPEFLPVLLSKELAGTVYSRHLEEEKLLEMMDSLNTLYVAFTRARCELYINVADSVPRAGVRIGGAEYVQLAKHILPIFRNLPAEESDERFPDPDLVAITETVDGEGNPDGGVKVEYGRPLTAGQVKEFVLDKDSDKISGQIAEEYFVNPDIDFLKYRETSTAMTHTTSADDEKSDEEEEDEDPRSEGNLLHSMMQFIETADDIPRAIMKLKNAGLLAFSDTPHYQGIATEAIKDAEPYGWFDGSKEVFTERPVLLRGEKPYRPDRIMVDPSTGACTIIDYKFGLRPLPVSRQGVETAHKSHTRQVRLYMDLLARTGRYSSVEGFVWYVKLKKIIPIL